MGYRESYDVVVIGGGPAGSTAATIVAQRAHKVLLLEREVFPRYHIGESLLPSTVHGVCRLLGVHDEIVKAGFVRKRGGTFRWGAQPEPWTFRFGEAKISNGSAADYAFQVERSKFDDILLRNASRHGVDVRERHAVTSVEKGESGSRIRFVDNHDNEHQVEARYVVDASGSRGILADDLGHREYDPFFRNIAVFGYYYGGKRLPDPDSRGNILCAAFDRGWIWYIPLSDNLTSVGVVLRQEELDVVKSLGPERAYVDSLSRCELIAGYLKDAVRVTEGDYGSVRVIRDYSYTNTKFWRPGAVLVGDAACFIDPVFSSGVHLATFSGLLAGRSINTCLAGLLDETASFSEFEFRYRREFAVFYEFLVAFYEMHHDETSYFWRARKILAAEEPAREAFVRLVAGLSMGGDEPAFHFQNTAAFHESVRESAGLMTSVGDFQTRGDSLPAEIEARLRTNAAPRLRERTNLLLNGNEAPLRVGGLVPTVDGLAWRQSVNDLPEGSA